jgi:sugar/nucleoside kinase (ribokinase family)
MNYRPALWKDPNQALAQAEDMLSRVEMIKVNEEEAALLCGLDSVSAASVEGLERAAQLILSRGPELVVITLGRHGSYFQIKDGGAYIPPFVVDTIDAIGCGDAFTAGLLSQLVLLKDWRTEISVAGLRENLKFANAVGALTSTRRGVITALPYLDEVNQFLLKRNDE